MEEKRISFETAKLAKEKGFNYPCDSSYVEFLVTQKSDNPSFAMVKGEVDEDSGYFVNNGAGDLSNEAWIGYAKPTQSHLQAWLRNVSVIDIVIVVFSEDEGITRTYQRIIYTNIDRQTDDEMIEYNSYEEALEAALVEALNLILVIDVPHQVMSDN